MSAPMARTAPLSRLAKTIRSKNAGVDKITFDGSPDSRISDYVEFDPALAIKFTIYRMMPSGSLGDADIFGSQQYGPLLSIEVPVEDAGSAGFR